MNEDKVTGVNLVAEKPAKPARTPKPAKARAVESVETVADPGEPLGDNVLRLRSDTVARAVEFYLNARIFRVPVTVESVWFMAGTDNFEIRLGEQ